MPPLVDTRLADRIRSTPDPDQTGAWPAERLRALRDCGVFRWGLPVEFGGLPVSAAEMLDGYVDLARLCLTTAFILTQRDAACHRIAGSPNLQLRQSLLPEHCSGQALATVGLSHLSTSRQHWARPSVVARRVAAGFELTGEAPWTTGARHADLLVIGATLDDGGQVLLAIPTRLAGITVGPPLKLLALSASCTGSVLLDRVVVSEEHLVAGPSPQVMRTGATGGTGSLTTTAVAIGASARTLQSLREEASSRPELEPVVGSLNDEFTRLRADLISAAAVAAAGNDDSRTVAEQLRYRANSLATRTALALVNCAKGAGFVVGHPAEQSVREAMFFHVWSCPPTVTRETLIGLIAT